MTPSAVTYDLCDTHKVHGPSEIGVQSNTAGNGERRQKNRRGSRKHTLESLYIEITHFEQSGL